MCFPAQVSGSGLFLLTESSDECLEETHLTQMGFFVEEPVQSEMHLYWSPPFYWSSKRKDEGRSNPPAIWRVDFLSRAFVLFRTVKLTRQHQTCVTVTVRQSNAHAVMSAFNPATKNTHLL